MPEWMRNPAPLGKAIDAIEGGIARRSARVWSPRWVGPLIYLRGVLQPLLERQALRDIDSLRENVRISETSGEAETMDPLLGVSAKALPDSERAAPHI
jgi:hypothetical protein